MSFDNIFKSLPFIKTDNHLDYNSFYNNDLAQQNKMILNTSNKVIDAVLSKDLPVEFQNPISEDVDQDDLVNFVDSQTMQPLLEDFDPISFDMEQFFAESFGETNSHFSEAPVPIQDERIKKRKVNTNEEIQMLSDNPVSKTIRLSNLKSFHFQRLLDNALPALNDETRCYFKNLINELISIRKNEVEVEIKHLRALVEKQMVTSTRKGYDLRSSLVAILEANGEKIQIYEQKHRITVKTIKDMVEELPSNPVNEEITNYINTKTLLFYEMNNLRSIELSNLSEEDVCKLKSLVDGLEKKQQKNHRGSVNKINELFNSKVSSTRPEK